MGVQEEPQHRCIEGMTPSGILLVAGLWVSTQNLGILVFSSSSCVRVCKGAYVLAEVMVGVYTCVCASGCWCDCACGCAPTSSFRACRMPPAHLSGPLECCLHVCLPVFKKLFCASYSQHHSQVGGFTSLSIPILWRIFLSLKETGMEVTTSLSMSHQEIVVTQSSRIVQDEMFRAPKCAQHVALAMQQGRIGMGSLERMREVGLFLRAMTDLYDMGEVLVYSSRSGDFIARERRARASGVVLPEYWVWMSQSQEADQVGGIRNIVGSRSDPRGYATGPVLATVEDLDLAARPWFRATRNVMAATWIPPYTFVNSDDDMGAQTCSPVYDDSSLPKKDPASLRGGPGAQESLSAVVCCGGQLSDLARLMSQQEGLEQDGAAFLVDVSDRSDSGCLIASAQRNNPLPYSDGGPSSSPNPVVGAVGKYLGERYGWEQLPENDTQIPVKTLAAIDDYFSRASWTQMSVRTWLVEGIIADWYVDQHGKWSSEPFQVAFLDMALVFALATNERHADQLNGALRTAELRILWNLRDDLVMLVITSLFAALMSAYVGLQLRGALLDLNKHMHEIQNLRFEGSPKVGGMSEEIFRIRKSFHTMRTILQLSRRFVPGEVMERLTSKTVGVSAGSDSEGSIFCARKTQCTVMYSTFENFVRFSAQSLASGVRLQIIELCVKTCGDIIEEHGELLLLLSRGFFACPSSCLSTL